MGFLLTQRNPHPFRGIIVTPARSNRDRPAEIGAIGTGGPSAPEGVVYVQCVLECVGCSLVDLDTQGGRPE